MYNSPGTPAGTGDRPSSSTNSRVFAIGRPIGTGPTPDPSTSPAATITVASLASRTWLDKLPSELKAIVIDAGQQASRDVYDWAIDFNEKQRKVWIDNGGEIVKLSDDEHAKLMSLMRPIGQDIASRKPPE